MSNKLAERQRERFKRPALQLKGVKKSLIPAFISKITIMLKHSEKTSGQNGAKILQEAASEDKVRPARFVLDALDGKVVDRAAKGATTSLVPSVLLPDTRARSTFARRDAGVNRRDECGRTALSHACEHGRLDAVKALVQNNADPELVDMWGNTALMYASVAGHSSVVDFLVRAFKRLGLQIDRQNKVGNSAVEVAKYLGHQDCLFALTGKAKKRRGNATSTRRGSERNTAEDQFGRSPDASEVKAPRGENHVCPKKGETTGGNDELCFAATSGRRKSSLARSRVKSMDSIEEFERECEGAPSSSGVLSDVSAPEPHARPFQPQRDTSKTKRGDYHDHRHLQPSSRRPHSQFPPLFSPRPAKNASNRCASTCPGAPPSGSPQSSPLGILLTPIRAPDGGRPETESETRKKTAFDFGLRRFDDNYYQKRSSLPTSVPSPAPPGRSLLPSRKARPAPKNAPLGSAAVLGAPSTFAVLGNKLLRRFTFPEFKKTLPGSPDLAVRATPKSETFPPVQRHPQVGSKSSIDSISGVKCEFDFQPKQANPF